MSSLEAENNGGNVHISKLLGPLSSQQETEPEPGWINDGRGEMVVGFQYGNYLVIMYIMHNI